MTICDRFSWTHASIHSLRTSHPFDASTGSSEGLPDSGRVKSSSAERRRIVRRLLRLIVILSVTWLGSGAAVSFAQDTGAALSGSWETAATWTGGTVPNSSNNVYIGSTYPTGAASTATVTLGANESASNLYLGNGSGTSGTLDLAGNTLTIVNDLVIAQNGGTGVLNQGGGSFTAQNAFVESGNSLTFGSKDAVFSLQLSGGSSATTSATGNITGNVGVMSGSTLTFQADMSIGSVNVQDSGSTFNMAGHNLTAELVLFGSLGSAPVNLQNLGNITASNLDVGNGMNFNITASDTVTSFFLSGGASTLYNNVGSVSLSNNATAATTAAGTATTNASVASGSTLTLGANMNLTGDLQMQDSGSTFNMAGHNLTADTLYIAWFGIAPVTVEDRGNITANNVYVGNGTNFNINQSDAVTNFTLNESSTTLIGNVTNLNMYNFSTATTTASGSVTGNVIDNTRSVLTLGADLSLTGSLTVEGLATLNAQGHAITADTLLLENSLSVTGLGTVTLNNLQTSNAVGGLTLHGGDVVNSQIELSNFSVLSVQQTNGIGLTFNGTSAAFEIDSTSSIDLIFAANSTPNWDFRWADPSGGGNWISTIDSMIADGQIVITAPNGYTVDDRGGYTYIDGITVSSVPEPSSLVLACLATAGVAAWMRSRRRLTSR